MVNTRWLFGMAFLVGAPHFASPADGAQPWERVLDQILARAEAERSDVSALGASSPQASADRPPNPASNSTAANPLVEGYVRYFLGTGVGQFQASRKRLEEYRSMIEEVLDQEGLPRELMWIGLVESGYNPLARSPKNAVGIWQFIPETAQTFGLRVDGVDERSDPLKSTRAAARYLKFLYAKFRDWPLVLAAYNAGERRVQNALERSGRADFWQLAQSGLLPRETQAYVPAVLAAQLLGERQFAKAAPSINPAQSATSGVVFATFDVSR